MQTNYTKKFFESPLKFMKEYAISPPNSVAGNKGRTALDLDTTGFVPNVNTYNSQPRSIRYARMMQGEKVAYIKFYKDKQMGGRSGTEQEGIDALRFDSSYDETSGWKPIYFLPWDTTGAIIRLSIPRKGTLKTDPDIFFTATINGCSVFIQGDTDSPTVYHAGGNTGQSDHNEAAKFWREALRNHIANSASAKARGEVKAEVNKTAYVKTPGTAGNSTTPRAQEYEDWLKAKLDKTGKFTVTMVNPWGCVMGIRSGRNWTFYLQENATVVCNHVSKSGVVQKYYARPMHVRQIYPGSGAIATMCMKVPVKVS
jgi:hypothetical protein